MVFILRINEILNFGHIKFSYSKKSISGTNFISETFTKSYSTKWKLSIVKIQEFIKIGKYSLGSLRSKIGNLITLRTQCGLKHKIKSIAFGNTILTIIRILNIKSFYNLVKFLFILKVRNIR
jgi:hypothetical protein